MRKKPLPTLCWGGGSEHELAQYKSLHYWGSHLEGEAVGSTPGIA
jgi:hypothetical protein